jgi:hypothetical protein
MVMVIRPLELHWYCYTFDDLTIGINRPLIEFNLNVISTEGG